MLIRDLKIGRTGESSPSRILLYSIITTATTTTTTTTTIIITTIIITTSTIAPRFRKIQTPYYFIVSPYIIIIV